MEIESNIETFASVVMHEYNEERYISELIQSNLNQAFQEFVFIIVEDEAN